MKAQAMQAHLFERIVVRACALMHSLVKTLSPYRVQRHFASKPAEDSVTLNQVYNLPESDPVHVCRINSNRMKGDTPLAKRGDLVKIVNPANGAFVLRFAQGSGEHRIRHNAVGLDYEARLQLGLSSNETELFVCRANAADREFYLMYLDHNASARQSRIACWVMIFCGAVVLFSTIALVSMLVSMA